MFKIALMGMKGKRKSSLQLFVILFLSFFLVVTSILTFSSISDIKRKQAIELFGSFENVYQNISAERLETLKEDPSLIQYAASEILGFSEDFGNVHVMTPELEELLSLKLVEGRLPEKEDEVILDINQQAFFKEIPQLGDFRILEVEDVIYNHLPDAAASNLGYATTTMEEIDEETKRSLFQKVDAAWKNYFVAEGYVQNEKELEDYILENFSRFSMTDTSKLTNKKENLNLPDISVSNESTISHATTHLLLQTVAVSFIYDAQMEDPENTLSEVEIIDHSWLKAEEDARHLPPTINLSESREEERKKSVLVYKNMKVVGFFNNITNLHEFDANIEPTAFVSEEAGSLFRKGINHGRTSAGEEIEVNYNLYLTSSLGSEGYYHTHEEESGLYRNVNAYPSSTSTEESMNLFLLGFIYILTFFNILQIFVIQLRKRTRVLALFKSIGAIDSQLRVLMFSELLILIIFALPLALLLGVGVAKLLITLYATNYQTEASLIFNYKLLGIGLLISVLCSFLGILLPLLKLKEIKLTGTISTTSKKIKDLARIKKRFSSKEEEAMSISSIARRHNIYKKKEQNISGLLYVVMLSALILSLMVGFLAFRPYIDNVLLKNTPDMVLTDRYSTLLYRKRDLEEEFQKFSAIKDYEILNLRDQMILQTPEGFKDPVLEYIFKSTPFALIEVLFDIDYEKISSREEITYENVYPKMTLMGIDLESDTLDILKRSSKHLNFDEEKFDRGEQAFLLVPRFGLYDKPEPVTEASINTTTDEYVKGFVFKSGGNNELSYSLKDRELLEENKAYDDFKEVELLRKDMVIGSEQLSHEWTSYEVEIAGVIHTLEEGIWPISDSMNGPMLIGSDSFVTSKVYQVPYGRTTYIDALKDRDLAMLGRTLASVHFEKGEMSVEDMVQLRKAAMDLGYEVQDLRADKENIYAASFRTAAAAALFALALLIIALQIEYNSMKSRLSNERNFVGILQSMGLNHRELSGIYMKNTLKQAFLALLLSHLLAAGLLFVSTYLKYRNQPNLWDHFLSYLSSEMLYYPYEIHGIFILIFLIIILCIGYIPLRKIARAEPIYNIKELH